MSSGNFATRRMNTFNSLLHTSMLWMKTTSFLGLSACAPSCCVTCRPQSLTSYLGQLYRHHRQCRGGSWSIYSARHHYLVIPVVDEQGKLLGIVTQDDAMRFAEENAEEDMLRMSGIVGGDEFRDMPLRKRSGRRLSWLSVNILLNVLAASVIAIYQDTLREVIALAVFLPIISDMSGCSGNQAVAVSIRELSLGRVTPRQLFWVLKKEMAVGNPQWPGAWSVNRADRLAVAKQCGAGPCCRRSALDQYPCCCLNWWLGAAYPSNVANKIRRSPQVQS
jgi:CBS domain-containing protein